MKLQASVRCGPNSPNHDASSAASESMQVYKQRRSTRPSASCYIALLSLLVGAIARITNAGSARSDDTCQSPPKQGQETLWTVVIPDGFLGTPMFGGSNLMGPTLKMAATMPRENQFNERCRGRWTIEGARMILRQDTLGFVFDGIIAGDQYSGTLYLGTRPHSRFSATKGDNSRPPPCKPPLVG
jgi:hypothetical protein